MSTNYYVRPKSKNLAKIFNATHLGKSSAGWFFSLHVYPSRGIDTLDDWKRALASKSVEIVDEYGTQTSLEEFIKIVTERSRAVDDSIDVEKLKQHTSDDVGLDEKRKLLFSKPNSQYGVLGPDPSGGTWCCMTCDFS